MFSRIRNSYWRLLFEQQMSMWSYISLCPSIFMNPGQFTFHDLRVRSSSRSDLDTPHMVSLAALQSEVDLWRLSNWIDFPLRSAFDTVLYLIPPAVRVIHWQGWDLPQECTVHTVFCCAVVFLCKQHVTPPKVKVSCCFKTVPWEKVAKYKAIRSVVREVTW